MVCENHWPRPAEQTGRLSIKRIRFLRGVCFQTQVSAGVCEDRSEFLQNGHAHMRAQKRQYPCPVAHVLPAWIKNNAALIENASAKKSATGQGGQWAGGRVPQLRDQHFTVP